MCRSLYGFYSEMTCLPDVLTFHRNLIEHFQRMFIKTFKSLNLLLSFYKLVDTKMKPSSLNICKFILMKILLILLFYDFTFFTYVAFTNENC